MYTSLVSTVSRLSQRIHHHHLKHEVQNSSHQEELCPPLPLYHLTSNTPKNRINFIDPSKSRFDPRLFYWVFIPCDIVSLVLQAVGGALSSLARTEAAVNRGVKISLAGLVFQVVTLVAFTLLFLDYLRSCGFLADVFSSSSSSRRGGSSEKEAGGQQQQRFARPLRVFMAFLFLATLFVFVRCAYRIKELSEGYFSQFFREEGLFIGLESWYVHFLCVTQKKKGAHPNDMRESNVN